MVVGKRLMRTQASDIFFRMKCDFLKEDKRTAAGHVCISRVAIPYVDKIKYLGVSLSASRTLDVDVSFMQRRFYSSYISIRRLYYSVYRTLIPLYL